ncbi:hypothetical protein CVD25_01290 [Bacillus canaveralius]|uniref:Flagellar protein n=1 Tax=Bacillus canaveralius TaxID=1403243 RepID=A0A2N5GN32_9BACI|nr:MULTISPECIES: hypothetical protein [Bacillus]PLR81372.1 hypothetical protein CVD23_18980 [Bacillus sp. V33-4]PLR83541.1 hypothetical protein CU635_08910 [Bacillus canaveralius]PLS00727.1 hypothetical protein CVD25_01290 [Bacillus canaveralius]RSK48616.1 hypothetical protein EJA13_16735 [Bacillus canaveralius]
MELINCIQCHEIFVHSGTAEQLCAKCAQQESVLLREVKHYLRRKPKATILEIQEDLNIPSNIVIRWKKENRI